MALLRLASPGHEQRHSGVGAPASENVQPPGPAEDLQEGLRDVVNVLSARSAGDKAHKNFLAAAILGNFLPFLIH